MTLPLTDPVALLRALIDIPSTTWEEGPVCEAVARTLEGAGFAVERQPVSTGRFRAHMIVRSELDGPVTILLDSRKRA